MSLYGKKEKAIILRQKGFSYGQILKELHLASKGTLSQWFKNLKLTDTAKSKLEKNNKLAIERGLTSFNKKRSATILQENEACMKNGASEIAVKNKKDLLLLGAALYWGEGTKYIGKHPSLVFTNSDPEMIRIYMKFLREGLCVDEQRIKAGIHIHPHVDEKLARSFWSTTTGLHESIFYIINVVSSASSAKRPIHKLPYGMVVIRVNNRQIFYRVKGMIEGLKILK